MQRSNGLINVIVDFKQRGSADDFDYFINIFINIGYFETAALFLGRFTEMQKDPQPGAVDIAELFKIGDDIDKAFRKQIADFFQYGLNIGGIKVTDKPYLFALVRPLMSSYSSSI